MPSRLLEEAKLQENWSRKVDKRNQPFQETFQQELLVTEGQEVELVIDGIGGFIDGTARIHGFSVFVPQSTIGERLKAEISKISRGFALAERMIKMGGRN